MNRADWMNSLPRDSTELEAYSATTIRQITEYVEGMPHSFPVAIDWDRQLSGAAGMGISPLPCWAFVGTDGMLRDIVPGRYEIVNQDGVFIESTLPSIEALRGIINRWLLSDDDA